MKLDEAGLIARIAALQSVKRSIVGIAGPPGAGKSTLVDAVVATIPRAAVLPMDGYHFDDGLLRELGRYERKGAPDTFDVGGLRHTIKRLRAHDEAVAVPVFDRDLEISRGSARIIGTEKEIILVEGNYLLVNEAPWDTLADLFDLTVMIEVSETELERRLRDRWQGFGLDDAGIRRKLEEVDLPNGLYVLRKSRAADLVYDQAL